MSIHIFYDPSLSLAPVPVWVGYIGPYMYIKEILPGLIKIAIAIFQKLAIAED